MEIQKLISLPPGMPAQFHRLEGMDPQHWFAGSDPEGSRAGSGGGTAAILEAAYRSAISGSGSGFMKWLAARKRIVIHSGGESRRLPAYAPFGKSLLPLPVFRWSRGQYLDQKLLGFQAGFYERIFSNAPSGYRMLVGTGDVLFLSADRFRNLPSADVLLFGVWVDEETASRHGVFFSERESGEALSFLKQKPSLTELRVLSNTYNYLMDSGIALLSDKAVNILMERSGWDSRNEQFRDEGPLYYDLYGEMFAAFGTDPAKKDAALSALDVKLVPLQECEFYHFGSNRDLIGSTLRLQNRIRDQRMKLTREADHHPSIFQQNSSISIRFTDRNHHLWIENCHIPAGWELQHHHILTGIPENDWNLTLPAGICLDVVLVGGGKAGIRTYGFDDDFRDGLEDGGRWMDQSLDEWFRAHSLDPGEAGILPEKSLFDAPLFPVVPLQEIPALVKFMVSSSGRKGDADKWLASKRLSAKGLSRATDIPSVYRQREELMVRSLKKLASNQQKSIFYFLDLEKTAAKWRANNLELPEPLSVREPLIKKINDQMFRSRVLGGKSEKALEFEGRAFGMLREEMIETLRNKPVTGVRNILDDQILWGRCPVRLDLAGGWTDTPPYCILEGGTVVNLSVELNGQMPLQVFARPLDEPVIVLRSIDLGSKLKITSYEELEQYDRLGGGFSIPMAALVLSGFGHLFSGKQYPDLKSQLKAFGCGIEMSLLAAVPKGSGLGTSSNLAAAVLGTLSEFCGLHWDKHETAYRTLILEQMLTTGGGWQDQYGGIFEGVKLLETEAEILQKPAIKWLPEQLFTHRETAELMLLYYTGVTRVAHDILGEIVKGMFLNSSRHLAIFQEMKSHARETFETILAHDYEALASRVAHSWELNKQLDAGTNPPSIQEVIAKVNDLMLGYKLLGAGGGGYLLMLAKSTEAALRAKKILESDPHNPRARFVDFTISAGGFQVSRS